MNTAYFTALNAVNTFPFLFFMHPVFGKNCLKKIETQCLKHTNLCAWHENSPVFQNQ